jgi:hypothetical protein
MRGLLLALIGLLAAAQARAEIDSGIDWEPLLSPSFANEADTHPYPYGHAESAAGFATAPARTPEAQPLCANASESHGHIPTDLPERPAAARMWTAHCLLGFVGAVTALTLLVMSQRACAKVTRQDAVPDDTVQPEAPREAQHLRRRADAAPACTHSASAQTANRPSEQALGIGQSCLFASGESARASPGTVEQGAKAAGAAAKSAAAGALTLRDEHLEPLPHDSRHEETLGVDDGPTESEEQDATQPYYSPVAAVGEGASVSQAGDQVEAAPVTAPSAFGQKQEQGQQEAVDMEEDVADPCRKDQAADSAKEGSASADEAVLDAGPPSTCSFLTTSSAPPSAPASRASSPAVHEGSKRKRKQPDWYEVSGFRC